MNLYENHQILSLRHVTQKELADYVDYTDRSIIAKIEKGKIYLPTSKSEKIASILNVTPSRTDGGSIEIKVASAIP